MGRNMAHVNPGQGSSTRSPALVGSTADFPLTQSDKSDHPLPNWERAGEASKYPAATSTRVGQNVSKPFLINNLSFPIRPRFSTIRCNAGPLRGVRIAINSRAGLG